MIYIIILNWNGLDDTLACLASLRHITLPSGAAVQTVVIDNASDVAPCETIKQQFANVKTVRNAQNLGFTGGCNVGIRLAMAAGADAVLLLNNDTVVAPDFLAQLLAAQRNYARPAIFAPVIFDLHARTQVTFAGGTIDFALGKFNHKTVTLGDAPTTHDYITGCCMLIPRDVIAQIGELEPSFFAYCEDVDYCLRARQRGIDCVLVPNSHIWHNESASTRRDLAAGTHSPLKHYLLIRNQIRVVKRYAPMAAKALYFGLHLPLRTAYYSIGFVLRGRWGKLRAFWRGVANGVTSKMESSIT